MPSFRNWHARIPPLPQFIILLDRDDGSEWVLRYNLDEHQGQSLHITLCQPVADCLPAGKARTEFHRFGREGAGIGQGVQLIVRGGRLGYELVQYVVTGRTHARKGVQRRAHAIVVPSGWEPGDALAFEEESPIP
jgi:hypothetical protein